MSQLTPEASMLLFPFSFSLPYPSEVLGLSTTEQSRTSKLYFSPLLKVRISVEGCVDEGIKMLLVDCKLTKDSGASSSWQRLSHQGMRQSGQGFYPLLVDFILVGYICGAGDNYTGKYGKIQWQSSSKMDLSKAFACARSLERLVAAASINCQ